MYWLFFLSLFLFETENSPDCETIVSYLGAQNVFIGQVLDIQDVENEFYSKITFQVQKVYKTENNSIENNRIATIYSVLNIYGYEFEKEKIYLVFQNIKENKKLIVDGCTLTSRIKTKKQNNLTIFPSIETVIDHDWGNSGRSDLSVNWLIKE